MLWEKVSQLFKIVCSAEYSLLGLGRATHNHEVELFDLPQTVFNDHIYYCHYEWKTIELMRLNIDCITHGWSFKSWLDIAFPPLVKLSEDELVFGLPLRSRYQLNRVVPSKGAHRFMALQVVLVNQILLTHGGSRFYRAWLGDHSSSLSTVCMNNLRLLSRWFTTKFFVSTPILSLMCHSTISYLSTPWT